MSKHSGSSTRKRQQQVTVRLTSEEYAAVADAASRAGVSPASVLRETFLRLRKAPPAYVPEVHRGSLHLGCPFCGAHPGQVCQASGGRAQWPHAVREALAKRGHLHEYAPIPGTECPGCGEPKRQYARVAIQWHRPGCPHGKKDD